MRRIISASLLAVVLLWCSAPRAAAQAAAVSDLRAEVLFWIEDAETKLIRLAEAIPQEKYTWRPGEGVRSVSEVFLHVSGGNYSLPRLAGTPPPEGFAPQGFQTSTTDKAQILDHLKKSFAHVKGAVRSIEAADYDKPVRMFGRDSTVRNVLLLLATHSHEHLGQMIAYTRMNGITPPWTEEAQQRQQQQPAKRP
jgi:uncharacterized damage-inducible protein DinB